MAVTTLETVLVVGLATLALLLVVALLTGDGGSSALSLVVALVLVVGHTTRPPARSARQMRTFC